MRMKFCEHFREEKITTFEQIENCLEAKKKREQHKVCENYKRANRLERKKWRLIGTFMQTK